MKYELVKSSINDIDKLIEYKKNTIYEYAKELDNDEINRINNYVENNVPKLIDNYSNIVIDNNIVGCLLITNKDDGILLDEIFIEEEYRNNGIGTSIIKDILKSNNIVYLWVYKDNIKAINLYKRLNFIVINETNTRYYMKYTK